MGALHGWNFSTNEHCRVFPRETRRRQFAPAPWAGLGGATGLVRSPPKRSARPILVIVTKSLVILLVLALASCANSVPDPGYAVAVPPPLRLPATPARPAPQNSCTHVRPGVACYSGTGVSAAPSLGAIPAQSPSPTPIGAPAAPAQPNLPSLGSTVFGGPTGAVGTVVNQTGNTAVVAPVGGGAAGIYVPNGNGTATIFQPGGVPVVVPSPR